MSSEAAAPASPAAGRAGTGVHAARSGTRPSAGGRRDETPPAVEVRGLRKEFAWFASPGARLLEYATLGRVRRRRTVVALDGVSFQVAPGHTLGLVGANGAGKSTLLRILAGTLMPSAGEVAVRGRTASLLELGTGFQPLMSGRQNIVFNGRFLGLSAAEIRARMESIIAFAELGEAIERPLRTYSSGMQLRLAFAVAASVDPAILIIDEALAVGDAAFTQKCMARLRRFRDDGVTLLLASHDPAAIRSLCDTALLLDRGRVLEEAPPQRIWETYNSLIVRGDTTQIAVAGEPAAARSAPSVAGTGGETAGAAASGSRADRESVSAPAPPRRSGSFKVAVAEVEMGGPGGRAGRTFVAGEEVSVRVRALCLEEVDQPTVGILIRDRLGNDVYGTNTRLRGIDTGGYAAGDLLEVHFRMGLDLGPGDYSLTVALHSLETHLLDSYDWIDRLLVFRVIPPPGQRFLGVAYLRPRIGIHRAGRLAAAGDWSRELARIFGPAAPRRLQPGASGPPWLFSGWYPAESAPDGAFAWTGPRCTCILDLRGGHLDLEVGGDPTSTDPVRCPVRVHGRELGTLDVEPGPGWSVARFPLPADLATGPGLVQIAAPGWRPAERGLGEDRRLLGLRVRRVEAC